MKLPQFSRVGAIRAGIDRRSPRTALLLLASELPPGALTGVNEQLAEVLRTMGVPFRTSCLALPDALPGTTILVDALGPTVRAEATFSRKPAYPEWLDHAGVKAAADAEKAAGTLVQCFGEDEFPTVALAPGEPEPMKQLCGPSVGLGIAIAMLSRWLEQPTPADTSVSGVVRANGTLEAIDYIEAKTIALVADRPWVRRLLVPGERGRVAVVNGVRVEEVDTLADAAHRMGLDTSRPSRAPMIRERLPGAVDATMALVRNRTRDNPWLLDRIERLWELISHEQEPTFELDTAALHLCDPLAEFRTHRGQSVEAAAVLDALRKILERRPALPQIIPGKVAGALNSIASGFIDLGEATRARDLCVEGMGYAAKIPPERLRLQGTLGRIEAHSLHDSKAAELLRLAVDGQVDELPKESNIPRCYLISSLVRLGRTADARAQLREGRAVNDRHKHENWARDNTVFLDLEEVKIALVCGAFDRVEEIWNTHSSPSFFWPRLGFLRRYLLSLLQRDQVDRAIGVANWALDSTYLPSHIARRLAAVTIAPLAASLLDDGRSSASVRFVAVIREVCAEVPATVDLPFAPWARRIASEGVTPELLCGFAAGEIY